MDPHCGSAPRRRLDLLALWILFSSWCSLSGWILSLGGILNGYGYAVALLALAGLLALGRKSLLCTREGVPFRRLLRSRWWLPKIWAGLTCLVLIGGLLYYPANYDHLTYRFPRVLVWAWQGHWLWIPTSVTRLNYSGTGFEWLMMPLFLLFRSDRLFFLINFVSYLFLPGLIFSVFRRLGLSPRICWWWMWVFPCGYCYILQAGSVGNDSFAVIYLLAALRYALPARDTSSPRHLVLSVLAVALLTGAKASNLFLVLPWLVAAFWNRARLLAPCRPVVILVTLVVAAAVSFLPIAAANIYYTGDFAGDPQNLGKMKLSDPVSGFIGNGIMLVQNNVSLPFWYKPISWEPAIPPALKDRLKRNFPRFGSSVGELQIEEGAGAGLGIVIATALMVLLRFRFRPGPRARDPAALWIVSAGVVSLLAYAAKMGSDAAPRLVAAYYPLLVAAVLVAASPDGAAVRRGLARTVAVLVMLSAAPILILNPSRPLFPVGAGVRTLSSLHASPALLQRVGEVYAVYSERHDNFHQIRVQIPAGEKSIGFAHMGDEPEVSLWMPFGSRQVIDVSPGQDLAQLQALHVHLVLVEQGVLYRDNLTLPDLLKKWSATQVSQANISFKIHRGMETWYLLRIPSA